MNSYSYKLNIVSFVGISAQICAVTSQTCCPLRVEQSIDEDAFANVKEMMPQFSLYLNESDRNLFPNYGKVSVLQLHVFMYTV